MTGGPGYRWDEADRLFDQALELPPEDRRQWLDRSCGGNPALRQQVEALLQADAAASNFLELDGWRLAGPLLEAPADPPAGHAIGPYRLVRELARGGMGVVYLADRSDGQFEQRVALKLIKLGMDSDAIHRRFLAERQILARLNHPHIARLLDGGVSAGGQPFFAIEYIGGINLIAHCEARGLGIEGRLALFLDVCDAVRYAHQNLVVHRDLKPSNILVTPEGQAKLLDFGIAKLLDQEPGETGLTETGSRVMTPEYAAPEQVRGEPVTTATDVYALGAVLYELLSGRRAHRIAQRTPMEIVRAVCEDTPEPPSTVAPGSLRRRLRGDLDTIVLTALRKERDRRYATVEQLAGDIRRHRDRLPVSARPDTVRYRAAKFVGRHRLGVAASGAVALSVMAGLGGTIWQARVAAERAQAATAEAAKQRAVRDFLVQLFQASDPAESRGHELTARALLDRGRSGIDTALAGQPAVRAELLAVLGDVHGSLGHYASADTLFARAVALTRTLPDEGDAELPSRLTQRADNLLYLDQYDRADSLLAEALDRMRRRRADDPGASEPLKVRADAQARKGNYEPAATLAREALAIDVRYHGRESTEAAEDLDVLGGALFDAGDLPGTDSAWRAELAIRRKLLDPSHPELLTSMSNLASALRVERNYPEAERLLREVLAARRRLYPNGHALLANAIQNLSLVVNDQGRFAEAESLGVEALGMYRSLLGPDHSQTTRMLHNLAVFREYQGDLRGAERDLRDATERERRTLGPEHPQTLFSIDELANTLREQGRYQEASTLAQEALVGRRKALGNSHPDVARSLRNSGVLLREKGEYAEAERRFREALAIDRKALPAGYPETARVLAFLGAVLNDRERPGEAEPLLREALAIQTQDRSVTADIRSATRRDLGYSLALQGRDPEAEQLLLEAYRDLEAGRDYWSDKERRETARRLVELYRRLGKSIEARKYLRAERR